MFDLAKGNLWLLLILQELHDLCVVGCVGINKIYNLIPPTAVA